MPYPLPTLGATVDASGISAPTYAEILESLQASFQGIYGTDAYIDPDSQDGQWLAIVAKAVSDCNQAAIAAYSNYSPATAQGAGLSSAVKMNGLARRVPTSSTADVTVTGTASTIITDGQVTDANGTNLWNLPSTVIIPDAGTIVVTATCATPGAVSAAANTLTVIATPQLGWQTATNATEAAPGNPVETDAQLRRRQSGASQLPAVSALGALVSGLGDLVGVTEVVIHENYTDSTDGAGVPEHCIAVTISGGDVDQIASQIALKKTPGCNTFGSISVLTTDPNGLPITVNFSRPTEVPVDVVLNVVAGAGYSTDVEDAQKAAIAAYLEGLSIGETMYFNRLWVPANLAGSAYSGTFEVQSMTANAGTIDIPVAYNETIVAGTVTVNLV